MSYNHVLVGLDLSDDSALIIERVREMFADRVSEISLIHVIEPLSFTYGGDIPMDLSEVQNQIEQQATKKLAEVGQQIGVDHSHQHVLIGQPANEIHRFAKDNGIDLMVVGTHGRHGLSLLFGSTANGVLHGAPCDVFAVRLPNSS